MFCPVCRSKETKVVDSRISTDGLSIRRRRECTVCNYRFSTLEEMEVLDMTVVKNNGRREAYSRDKLAGGIMHSLAKRPFTQDKFRNLIQGIERDLQKMRKREVTSKQIGEVVMKHLRKFDKIAYIRFASIYRAFEDVSKFQTEIKSLQKGQKTKDNK